MRRRRRQRGATPIDILLLIGCVVLLTVIGSRVPELIDYAQRKSCYHNQELLDDALYQVLHEQREELYHVAFAYVVRSTRAGSPSKLVVLFRPKEGDFWDDLVAVDLPEYLLASNLVCPVDDHAEKAPVLIDYAFLWGRWRCLYEVTHN